MQSAKTMPWFVRGDIDGFFGLALDNLVQLLLIRRAVFAGLLGFSDALLYGRVLPGVCGCRSWSAICSTRTRLGS